MHSLSHDTDMDNQSCSHSYSHHTDIDMATPPLPRRQSRCRCLCSCFLDHNRQRFHHLTLPLYCSINRPPSHSGLVSYSSDFYVLVCMTNFCFEMPFDLAYTIKHMYLFALFVFNIFIYLQSHYHKQGSGHITTLKSSLFASVISPSISPYHLVN